MYSTNTGAILHELDNLKKDNAIPLEKCSVTSHKRWQPAKYEDGIHFNPNGSGRYNYPDELIPVCYTSDFAVLAIAEVICRAYHNDSSPIANLYSLEALNQYCMYTLRTTRTTYIVNTVKLFGKLKIPIDKYTGPNYFLTQSISHWLYHNTNCDGISYISRHYSVGNCTAFFERDKNNPVLEVVECCSAMEYLDSDSNNFPANWGHKNISAESIVYDTLGFNRTM